jgi:IS30 family transposase
MKDKTAAPMHGAVTRALSGLPCGLRKTLIYDNGLENALHERMNRELGITSYFCKPYHSWEKGSDRKSQRDIAKIFP